jgi:hypothetical protein
MRNARRAPNGQNRLHEKCPARQNCQLPIEATRMLSASAMGLISAGARLRSDITAM